MESQLKNVSELTKEMIGGLYIKSLGNSATRGSHNIVLLEEHKGPSAAPPSVGEVEIDFGCWYGGLQSLAQAIDPGVVLPSLKEMAPYINSNFEKAKAAIAA